MYYNPFDSVIKELSLEDKENSTIEEQVLINDEENEEDIVSLIENIIIDVRDSNLSVLTEAEEDEEEEEEDLEDDDLEDDESDDDLEDDEDLESEEDLEGESEDDDLEDDEFDDDLEDDEEFDDGEEDVEDDDLESDDTDEGEEEEEEDEKNQNSPLKGDKLLIQFKLLYNGIRRLSEKVVVVKSNSSEIKEDLTCLADRIDNLENTIYDYIVKVFNKKDDVYNRTTYFDFYALFKISAELLIELIKKEDNNG